MPMTRSIDARGWWLVLLYGDVISNVASRDSNNNQIITIVGNTCSATLSNIGHDTFQTRNAFSLFKNNATTRQ